MKTVKIGKVLSFCHFRGHFWVIMGSFPSFPKKSKNHYKYISHGTKFMSVEFCECTSSYESISINVNHKKIYIHVTLSLRCIFCILFTPKIRFESQLKYSCIVQGENSGQREVNFFAQLTFHTRWRQEFFFFSILAQYSNGEITKFVSYNTAFVK